MRWLSVVVALSIVIPRPPSASACTAANNQQQCRFPGFAPVGLKQIFPTKYENPCLPWASGAHVCRLRGGSAKKSRSGARVLTSTRHHNRKGRGSKDTVKTMAPPIDWVELEDPHAEKRNGKLLKERRKWENPHIRGKRVSLRQARVLRASNEIRSSCKASVSAAAATKYNNNNKNNIAYLI
jgi:hypothetical protein